MEPQRIELRSQDFQSCAYTTSAKVPKGKKIRIEGWAPDYQQVRQFKRIIQSRSNWLATPIFNERVDCLPPNGYRPQPCIIRFVRFLRHSRLANRGYFNFMLLEL